MGEPEQYVVTLPISPVDADVAGVPAEWLERAVRAIGHPLVRRITEQHAWSVLDGELEHTVTRHEDPTNG